MKTPLEYQLGFFVGEYVFTNHLPTLSIDSLKSRKVIQVTIAESDKIKAMEKFWSDNYDGIKGDADSNWIELKKFHNELALKYLPHTLNCLIPKINLEVIPDINKFKEGFRDSLWNTDLCWYAIKSNDDIEIINNEKDSWFTKIVLKLDLI